MEVPDESGAGRMMGLLGLLLLLSLLLCMKVLGSRSMLRSKLKAAFVDVGSVKDAKTS